jgi:hypothetical protein
MLAQHALRALHLREEAMGFWQKVGVPVLLECYDHLALPDDTGSLEVQLL